MMFIEVLFNYMVCASIANMFGSSTVASQHNTTSTQHVSLGFIVPPPHAQGTNTLTDLYNQAVPRSLGLRELQDITTTTATIGLVTSTLTSTTTTAASVSHPTDLPFLNQWTTDDDGRPSLVNTATSITPSPTSTILLNTTSSATVTSTDQSTAQSQNLTTITSVMVLSPTTTSFSVLETINGTVYTVGSASSYASTVTSVQTVDAGTAQTSATSVIGGTSTAKGFEQNGATNRLKSVGWAVVVALIAFHTICCSTLVL